MNKSGFSVYRPALKMALKARYILFAVAGCGVIFSIFAIAKVGKEFMPTLEEGSILIGVSMAPSIGLDKAEQTIRTLERKIVKLQPVRETVSRIGRPEAGSHPHPVNYAEIHIEFKPKKEWNSPPVFSLDHQEVTQDKVDLWEKFDDTVGTRFNLSIDLASCTGCAACIIACHTENRK